MPESISRRSFIGLLTASLIFFIAWWFRRADLAPAVQEFFGIQQDLRKQIQSRFESLRRRNASLYQQSVIFFQLYQFRLFGILPWNVRNSVITEWVNFLFYKRELAWPYVGYPSVNEFQICNGLIRK